eukprot:TRINITY_DN1414_c1_g2_i5.p1 TRINITY_DN1414_c1_g2~~TRINITY_DN1414_c1_g2_i5.p1  ORF type:complete len:523 (-),score=171.77 TRINITY_DN1414_c1_g2_i5:742-2310(-)
MQRPQQELPNILCCQCGTVIKPNNANMCIDCLKTRYDFTANIPTDLILHTCRSCDRYLRNPGWIHADLESKELLSVCLKKIRGLQKLKLVDAKFIWTEEHSRRIKLRVKLQKEVEKGVILQQELPVTFKIENQQCEDCERSYTDHTWVSVVQLRQAVEHKRTFLYLEQLILKHNAHEKTLNIARQPNGIDFFFGDRSHGQKFVEFLKSVVPIKYKTAKQLVSADLKSNTQKYKHTFSVDIAPVCRDDLVVLPKKFANSMSNIAQLCLVKKVSNLIQLIDTRSGQLVEMDAEKFYKNPYDAFLSRDRLIEFTVLDITPAAPSRKIFGRVWNGTRLVDMTVARTRDLGMNDQTFIVTSHLGNVVKIGDEVLGYDIEHAIFNDSLVGDMRSQLDDVIIVRKYYSKRRARDWKVKRLVVEQEAEKKSKKHKADMDIAMRDEEIFKQDIEEDPEFRQNVNIYKSKNDLKNKRACYDDDEEDMDEELPPELDGLLDDLDLDVEGMGTEEPAARKTPAKDLGFDDDDLL